MFYPDDTARGLLDTEVDVERYGGRSAVYDPDEAHGIIVDMIPYGARVLDVGCGTGACAILIKEMRGAEVIGIEPQPQRAQIAMARGLQVEICELSEVVLDNLAPFDVIVFADVLEHLCNPMLVLEVARRGLRPGGIIVVSVPNVAHWTVRCNLLRGRFNYQPAGIMDATHMRWFTQLSLEKLFRSAGYHIEARRVSLGIWMSVYSRVPWLWLGPKRTRKLLRLLASRFPTVFGCQVVLTARLRVQ